MESENQGAVGERNGGLDSKGVWEKHPNIVLHRIPAHGVVGMSRQIVP